MKETVSQLETPNEKKEDKEDKEDKKDEPITRESINISKNTGHNIKKRYVVTAAIAGADLDIDFFKSVQTYCKHKNAELVILPMRGVRNKDAQFCTEIIEHSDKFATEIRFNSRLIAQDFMINPQMINPLVGLGRYGQKKHSLIIASPKQFMHTIPVSNEDGPNVIHSTGSITIPEYASTRQGRLAEQDHCRGALIVEIETNKRFHIRQIKADDTGGFFDLGNFYTGDKWEQGRASAFIMADYHSGFQDEVVIANWKDCIDCTNPKFIIFHDIFDGHSINHHHINDIERQVNRKKEIDTLEKELNNVGKELKRWSDWYPEKELVVVHSNHCDFLKKYLTTVAYKDDRVNHKIALKLALWLMDELNPIEQYIAETFGIPNIRWLKPDKDYKIHDVRIGNHGHKPRNAVRSAHAMEKTFGNCITAHGHAPRIFRECTMIGTSTPLRLDYTAGSPTDWLNTSALLYKNGTKQLVSSIKGKWRLEG